MTDVELLLDRRHDDLRPARRTAGPSRAPSTRPSAETGRENCRRCTSVRPASSPRCARAAASSRRRGRPRRPPASRRRAAACTARRATPRTPSTGRASANRSCRGDGCSESGWRRPRASSSAEPRGSRPRHGSLVSRFSASPSHSSSNVFVPAPKYATPSISAVWQTRQLTVHSSGCRSPARRRSAPCRTPAPAGCRARARARPCRRRSCRRRRRRPA